MLRFDLIHVSNAKWVHHFVISSKYNTLWAHCFSEISMMSWWRHQMETFSALLNTDHLCWNSPVTGEFPAQRSVTRSFDVFFDLHLNKWWSKQSGGWWFETPSHPLWRHDNDQSAWGRWFLSCKLSPKKFAHATAAQLSWHVMISW